jgi:hypothetical protein
MLCECGLQRLYLFRIQFWIRIETPWYTNSFEDSLSFIYLCWWTFAFERWEKCILSNNGTGFVSRIPQLLVLWPHRPKRFQKNGALWNGKICISTRVSPIQPIQYNSFQWILLSDDCWYVIANLIAHSTEAQCIQMRDKPTCHIMKVYRINLNRVSGICHLNHLFISIQCSAPGMNTEAKPSLHCYILWLGCQHCCSSDPFFLHTPLIW